MPCSLNSEPEQQGSGQKGAQVSDTGGDARPAASDPSNGAEAEAFYVQIARKSAETQFREKRPLLARGGFLDRLFSEIEAVSGQEVGTVLDYGGDTGVTLALMCERLKVRRAVCYDLVPPTEPVPRIEYLHGSWEDLVKELPEGSVDLVLAEEVIEHVFSPDAVVERLKRLLKPGGLLVITTPNLSSAVNRIGLLLGRQPGGTEVSTEAMFTGKGRVPGPVAGHIRVFTFGALLEFLEYHGLRIVRAYTAAWPPTSGPTGDASEAPRTTLNLVVERFAERFGGTLASRIVVIGQRAVAP